MRISLLEQREPFVDIFKETMSAYWSIRAGQKIQVQDKPEGASSTPLYGHRFFNFFVIQGVKANLFEALKKEYSQSTSFLKSIGLRSYFALSTNKTSLPFFAHHKLMVAPHIPETEPFIIFGGNTRLRLVYPNENTSVVVLKKGFDENYILNEINFKENVPLTCAPKMISFDRLAKTITEEYTPGYPINRLAIEKTDRLNEEAWESLKKEVILPFVEKTTSSELAQNYCKELTQFVDQENTSPEINAALKELIALFNTSIPKNTSVKFSWSHGDFQNANILKTETGLKIIDWETAGKRIVIYDLLTMVIGTRSGNFNAASIINTIKQPPEILDVFTKTLNINWGKEHSTYLYFYLIEELIYRLHSSFSKMFFKNGAGILPIIATIKDVLSQKNTKHKLLLTD